MKTNAAGFGQRQRVERRDEGGGRIEKPDETSVGRRARRGAEEE